MTLRLSPVVSAAAWRGEDLARRSDWIVQLQPAQLRELEHALTHARHRDADLFALESKGFPIGEQLREMLARARDGLVHGPGVALLRGLPVERWGETRTRLALWGLGTHLGWPEPQDGAGSLLHDVRDVGRPFGSDSTIRYFQTNQAIAFHNDGADAFALLCLQAGGSGGRSRIVSAVEVFNTIVERRPDLAEVLQQDFHVDARGQRGDGARCQVIPIYAFEQDQPTILLKVAYIHSAQRFDDVPRLSDAQREALELLQAVMEEPGMAWEFSLQPGEMLLGSNHVLLHGRTAFTDASAQAPRHMLRLWLTLANGPPLPPHYADTREFAATYARRVAPGLAS
jgi:hypothetical protein